MATSTEERAKINTELLESPKKEAPAPDYDFVDEVRQYPGGEGVDLCYQCGTCAGTCPNAKEMDYTPREMIAMIRAGMKDQVLSSNTMWYCMSCYLCSVRCPRGVKITDMMYTLKNLAVQHKSAKPGNRPLAMARSFVDILNQFGRVHEASMLGLYYMRTNPITALPLAPVGIGLLTHGRLPLMPKSIKNKAQLQAIVKKAKELGGNC